MGEVRFKNCRGVGRITPFFVPNIKEETKNETTKTNTLL